MKVFVAGATGAIGKQLLPRLVQAGHEVYGMTRSESKQRDLYDLGATPVVGDGAELDAPRPWRVPRIVGRLLAGEAGGRRSDDDRGARRVQREGQARAALAAPPPDLARGPRGGGVTGEGRAAVTR